MRTGKEKKKPGFKGDRREYINTSAGRKDVALLSRRRKEKAPEKRGGKNEKKT